MVFDVGDVPYVKTKFTGLDGNTKVGWAEDGSSFEVLADKTGVYFRGSMKNPIEGMAMLQDFAELVTEAWKEHSRLKPKLAMSSHDIPDPQL